MRDADQRFNAQQLKALDRHGLTSADTPSRWVEVLTLPPASFTLVPSDSKEPRRVAICPILEKNENGDLIVLPDGQEVWVPRHG